MNFVPITFIQSSLRYVLISNPIVANIQKIEVKLLVTIYSTHCLILRAVLPRNFSILTIICD